MIFLEKLIFFQKEGNAEELENTENEQQTSTFDIEKAKRELKNTDKVFFKFFPFLKIKFHLIEIIQF